MELVLYIPGSCRPAAERIILDWVAENNRYYGQPHGSRLVDAINNEYAGYKVQRFGHPRLGNSHRWLTSGDNLHIIAEDLSHLAFRGRRHGMQGGFQELVREICALGIKPVEYSTSEPGWPPWATRDSVESPNQEIPLGKMFDLLGDGFYVNSIAPAPVVIAGRSGLLVDKNEQENLPSDMQGFCLSDFDREELQEIYGTVGGASVHAVVKAWTNQTSAVAPHKYF